MNAAPEWPRTRRGRPAISDVLDAWRDPDLTPARARAVQEELAPRVVTENRLGPVRLVAGADVAFRDGGRTAQAGACVLAYPALEVLDTAVARLPVTFPYVPGLLAFRELGPVVDVLARMPARPDVILCDGHGVAHPRRFGLACYVGLVTGIPTVGVAKSRFVGEFETPGAERGAWEILWHRGEAVGSVLRTRTGVRPVFVSPGHLVDQAAARELALACAPRYRVPEPTRRADRLAAGG